jgi:hypothetical protein
MSVAVARQTTEASLSPSQTADNISNDDSYRENATGKMAWVRMQYHEW